MPNGIDFARIIFETIFKIPTETVTHYTTLPDQLIYLFFIPHIIFLLFIYAFSVGFVGRIAGRATKLMILFAIAVYVLVVWVGWYGILVTWFTQFFLLAIFLGLVLFFVSFVIHPARGAAFTGLTKALGEKIGARGKEAKIYEQELEEVRNKIRDLTHLLNAEKDPKAREYFTLQINDYKIKEKELIRKLRG